MTLSIIVAMTKERVIGYQNKIPWHLSEDLKHFKKITMGHPIIMGRKTFESIGHPLPGRENIVITRNKNYKAVGVTIVHGLEEALKNKTGECFVIGGAEIYKAALPQADKLYLTLIHDQIKGDTFFPPVDLENEFTVMAKEGPFVSAAGNLTYEFITASRTVYHR